jgi:hypothetical protein
VASPEIATESEFEARLEASGIPYLCLGSVSGDRDLRVNDRAVPLERLQEAYGTSLRAKMEG